MKTKVISTLFATAALLSLSSCAGLGFDIGLGSDDPYPYDSGPYYYDTPGWGWGTSIGNNPYWNYGGPIYNPGYPPPHLGGPGHGQPVSPPPVINITNPGINGVRPGPTVGNIQRPGNGGLPNPSTVPTGRPIEQSPKK